ncbi:hypothetical protein Pan153_18080 [Gimesia panareensis]|uniref:DUF4303 domain-containing protein n=1 Tax=Gimesia panareensis TaxID=2527978 RepID=A0A518FLE6_9PLAN|nr:DUF4303 domain-containing protein [Gimesia panareensis]QDV17173.1 hypothetical protein Pan153_18080 [Gimesia panareensis]
MTLSKLLAAEAKTAFQHLIANVPENDIYGFALFTDDSAQGIDVAANTQTHLLQSTGELRNSRYQAAEVFSLKWYTTEWQYEGGYAEHFSKSDEAIRRLFQEQGEEARVEVFQAMIEALRSLRGEAFFESITECEKTVVLVSVTDSEDDEELMICSVHDLNTKGVYEEFIDEKISAGV